MQEHFNETEYYYVIGVGWSVGLISSLCAVYAKMILIITLFLLTHFSVSFEESHILQIPLRHSIKKFADVQVETDVSSSKAQHVDPNYNLHGMLGQGYYIELAVGQPEQLVMYIFILLCVI